VQQNEVESSPSVTLPRTMEEINEVQYAQNYHEMILVHENYAPLLVYLSGNKIYISKFLISYKIEVIAAKEIDKGTYINEYDSEYTTNKYLTSANGYPRSVTFFNGRLVFAGTRNNPQRIFFSSLRNIFEAGTEISNIHNFSTYKLYLTEQRDYVILHGEIDKNNKRQLILAPDEPFPAFQGRPEKYIVDSVYFPVEKLGKVYIDTFVGKVITFTQPPAVITGFNPNDVDKKINAYVEYNNDFDKSVVTVGRKYYKYTFSLLSSTYDVKVKIGAYNYQFIEVLYSGDIWELPHLIEYDVVEFSDDTAKLIRELHEGNIVSINFQYEISRIMAIQYPDIEMYKEPYIDSKALDSMAHCCPV
jgi:hypothetical protein